MRKNINDMEPRRKIGVAKSPITGGNAKPTVQGHKVDPANKITGGPLPPQRTPAAKKAASRMSALGTNMGQVYPKKRK